MQFDICGFVYKVESVAVTSSPEEPGALGYCNHTKRLIELRSDQSIDTAYQTLAHEFVHACESAGIDVYRHDDEQRANAAGTIACSFARQFQQQGGFDTLRVLLGIRSEGDEIQDETPLIAWDKLEGPALYAAVYRHVYCRGLNDTEFATFRAECEAKKLSPFLGDCYPIRDKQRGHVLICLRLGGVRRLFREFGGRIGEAQWFDGEQWKDVWVQAKWGNPDAARVKIERGDGTSFWQNAEFAAFAAHVYIGEKRHVTGMWVHMGAHLLANVCERLGAAKVIPQMSNVVIQEEMEYRPSRNGDVPMKRKAAPPAEMPEVTNMDGLHAALAGLGVTNNTVQQAIILRVRKDSGTLEDDNPAEFYQRVLQAGQKAAQAAGR